MSDAVVVCDLAPSDLPSAVGVVARGMRDNPLHIAAFGDNADVRGQRLIRLFTVVLPMVFSRGIVLGAFQDDTLIGIAGMIAPGQCQPSLSEKVALMPHVVPAVGSSLGRVSRWMAAWAQYDIKEPHWHLGPVAVDAHRQGQGIGSLLLKEYCTRVDRAHVAGYLETDKESNVGFYERFGFRTIASAPVLQTPNWFMKRDARSVVS